MSYTELHARHRRFRNGQATRDDIERFVDEVGRPDLFSYGEKETPEEREHKQLCNYAQLSKPYYFSIVVEYLKNTPPDCWGYSSACDYLGLLLKQHPAEMQHLAPLLQDEKLRLDAIMILGMSQTAEALPLLKMLFDECDCLDEETVVELVASLLDLPGNEPIAAIEELRLILSDRIAASPLIEVAFAEASRRISTPTFDKS